MSQIREAENKKEEFVKWFEERSVKVSKITYRPRQQEFDPTQAYRKPFKRLIDFYD